MLRMHITGQGQGRPSPICHLWTNEGPLLPAEAALRGVVSGILSFSAHHHLGRCLCAAHTLHSHVAALRDPNLARSEPQGFLWVTAGFSFRNSVKLSQGKLWESVLRVWKLGVKEGNGLGLSFRGSGGQEAT